MSEGSYLVTRDGTIIKRVESGDPTDLHVVTGVALKPLVDDREGATRTIRQRRSISPCDYDRSRSRSADRSKRSTSSRTAT